MSKVATVLIKMLPKNQGPVTNRASMPLSALRHEIASCCGSWRLRDSSSPSVHSMNVIEVSLEIDRTR